MNDLGSRQPGENGEHLREREPERRPSPPPIRYPDVAFEIGVLLTDAELDELRAGVVSEFPNAIVLHRILQGAAIQVGIWLTADGDDAARIRGLDRIPRRRSRDILRFYVSSGLINRNAAQDWRSNEMFHHLDHDGRPNRNGPIHLQNLFIDFQEPNRVLTTITGRDESAFPDVSFRIEIKEDLTTTVDEATGIHVLKVTRDVDFVPNTTVDQVRVRHARALPSSQGRSRLYRNVLPRHACATWRNGNRS
jgi:hypothetical protein